MFDGALHTGLSVVTPPASEPITRELARAHLRVDSPLDDVLIGGLISVSRDVAEKFLSRALLTQTLAYTISRGLRLADEAFGLHYWRRLLRHTIELPRAPVQSVTSVKILDSAAVVTTIDPSNYFLDISLEPARLRLDWQVIEQLTTISWPIEHIQITFVAGYAADNSKSVIAPAIIQAMLLIIAFYYEHRGDTGDEMPKAAESLLWDYRLVFFGA